MALTTAMPISSAWRQQRRAQIVLLVTFSVTALLGLQSCCPAGRPRHSRSTDLHMLRPELGVTTTHLERRPTHDGEWIAGPHQHNGRFAESSSSAADDDSDTDGSDDDAADPRRAHREHPATDGEDQDSDEWSWSSTSLDLAGPSLGHAVEALLGMYRNQLSLAERYTNRELGGRSPPTPGWETMGICQRDSKALPGR